jgi:hypothetical protein
MNIPRMEFNRDDIFVLGNIASMAVMNGFGEHALPILKLLREARPDNAGVILLEAMYLNSVGACGDAISLLENSDAFQALTNRDEAVAFHLYLLQQDGQIERAGNLGQTYLEENLVESEAACEAIRIITTECHSDLNLLTDDDVLPA